MKRLLWIGLLAVVLAGAGSTTAQICGDVDEDGSKDLSDASYLMSYLSDPFGSIPNPATADMDGHQGITVADLVPLMNWMFRPDPVIFDCSQGQTYTFAPSMVDTVFFPYMGVVPDGVDTVRLTIVGSLGADAQGFYLPMLTEGAGISLFRLDSVNRGSDSWLTRSFSPGTLRYMDTVNMIAAEVFEPIAGNHTLYTLFYSRTAPGVGSIVPQLVERSSIWKPSIERNSDLVVPVIQLAEYTLPPETLKVSMDSVQFHATAGYAADDSFLVNFTSSGLPIDFTLNPTQTWITVEDVAPVGFQTPAAVWVKANALQLGTGTYAGTILFENLNPTAPTSVPYIGVGITVAVPNVYPAGDINCDGIVDIGDLTMMILHLFMSFDQITPCPK